MWIYGALCGQVVSKYIKQCNHSHHAQSLHLPNIVELTTSMFCANGGYYLMVIDMGAGKVFTSS
ncbi:hypothetical protein E24_00484 [Faustovirus]|nr:hypothetical protein E24_00484 [Faustovirus]AMN85367.1 hypothetical protein E23_00484 [Faustovirus]